MTLNRSARTGLLAAAAGLAMFAVTSARAADIAIEQPWARAAQQGGVGAAFMRIENHGAAADRLVSASSPLARTVELHTTIRDGDVMRMRPVDVIEVPAHGTVQLQPGSLHIMLIGLQRPLAQGEQVPLTLTFERAGPVPVNLHVQAAGAMQGHAAPSQTQQR